MTPEFAAKYKDPRWQKRRLEILERWGWICLNCGSGEKTLHVHHVGYRRNADPWDYPDWLLVPLCEDCHAEETQRIKTARQSLNEALAALGVWSADGLEDISQRLVEYRENYERGNHPNGDPSHPAWLPSPLAVIEILKWLLGQPVILRDIARDQWLYEHERAFIGPDGKLTVASLS